MCSNLLTTCQDKLSTSNGASIALVYIILLIDNMLLTAVVPVLPEYLIEVYGTSGEGFDLEELNTTLKNRSLTNTPPSFIDDNQIKTGNCTLSNENKFLIEESLYIGILFASKPFVQSLANLAVGPIVDRVGFNLPMIIGNLIMCLSALLFAFGRSYFVLLIARAIQGIGSSSSSVAGISMLADRYNSNLDNERGKAIGIALGGLAMGVLIGPPFATGVFQLAGKEAVFLVLAVGAMLIAIFVVCFNGIKVQTRSKGDDPVPLSTLLLDPYIVLTAISLMLGNLGIGILEASQPLWMLETMCSQKWELGVAFLPSSLSYLVMVNIVAVFCQKIPRWFIAFIGLLFVGAGCFSVPFARNIVEIIPPGVVHGFGIGFVDSSIFPMMAFLVDTRHKSIYGSVYAIADLSFCFAFVIGPLYAAFATKAFGFPWLMRGFAIFVFLFSPLVSFLRKPTTLSEETMPLFYRSESKNDDYASSPNGSMMNSSSEEDKK